MADTSLHMTGMSVFFCGQYACSQFLNNFYFMCVRVYACLYACVCVCVTLKTNQEVAAWKIIPSLWALKMRGLGGSQELLTVLPSRLESMHHVDQKVDQNFWLL